MCRFRDSAIKQPLRLSCLQVEPDLPPLSVTVMAARWGCDTINKQTNKQPASQPIQETQMGICL